VKDLWHGHSLTRMNLSRSGLKGQCDVRSEGLVRPVPHDQDASDRQRVGGFAIRVPNGIKA
jgi:hypothetical protein